MAKGDDNIERQPYKMMEDTPFISQARDVSNRGYQDYIKNYQNVNVFSPEANRSLDAQANTVYKRAEDDFARNYTNTMRNLATRNYNQFGTLNATAPSYVTDMQNLQSQRALMDSAYNKALYREQLRDNELQRRYNTLGLFKSMYDYGQIPYQQDLMNYQTSLKNQDVAYQNALGGGGSSGKDTMGKIASVALPIAGAVAGTVIGGPAGTALGSSLGNALSSGASRLGGGYSGSASQDFLSSASNLGITPSQELFKR